MTERWKSLLILLGGLVLCGGLGLVSIHVPFGRDQGVSAYVAEVMAHGGAPYRDVYHFNFPSIFAAYLLARLIPLASTESVNLFHVVMVLLTYVCVYAAAAQIMSRPQAALAGFFYGAFAVVMYTDYWDIAQKESLACLPLALCLVAGLKAIPAQTYQNGEASNEPGHNIFSVIAVFFAGLFAGFAAQFKPTLGIVLIACFYPAFSGRVILRPSVKSILAAVAGFIVSFVPLLVYLTLTHSTGAMIDSVLRFGGFYGGQGYQGVSNVLINSASNIISWLFKWRFLAVLSVAAVPSFGKIIDSRRRFILLFGLLLLVQVIVQMKFFTYHWIPLLLPASVLAAEGTAYLYGATGRAFFANGDGGKNSRSFRAALVLVLFALFLGNLVPEGKRYKRELLYGMGMISKRDFLSPYGRWNGGDMCPLASHVVAEYIKKHTSPADPVLVFGLEPGLYVASDRFPPTRFAYDQPLVTDPGERASFRRYRSRLREEFLADLSQSPPAYIIVIENDATSIEPADSYEQMKDFSAFHELIKSDYFLENKIEDYFIFCRLGRGGH